MSDADRPIMPDDYSWRDLFRQFKQKDIHREIRQATATPGRMCWTRRQHYKRLVAELRRLQAEMGRKEVDS